LAALVLLFAAPLIPLFMVLVGRGAQAASKAQLVEMGGMNAFLLDRLRGLATLRALGAVDATAERLGDAAQSLRRRTMAVLRIAFLSSAVLELFSALGVAMVAVYVGFHLLGTLNFGAWGQRLGLGQGLFILLLAPAYFEPLRELAAAWHDRAAGKAALQALEQLSRHAMALPGGQVDGCDAETGPTGLSTAPSIVVRELHFAHPGQAPLFAGLDLRVAAGEHIALWGSSGSGKTVLLSLLAGLMPATSGQIIIGGVTLSDRSVGTLRQRIGWMGQHPHVFAAAVEANVALGRPGITRSGVLAAMSRARLGEVPRAQPLTVLGEGGSGLSGGEAVRLALARLAVHEHADLLLVDEPTAHLDTATANRVSEALVALAQGKTLIVATHDPVLAARMGRVIRLDAVALEEAA
jgi:ATP-binding cassette subfamily C protein CydD